MIGCAGDVALYRKSSAEIEKIRLALNCCTKEQGMISGSSTRSNKRSQSRSFDKLYEHLSRTASQSHG